MPSHADAPPHLSRNPTRMKCREGLLPLIRVSFPPAYRELPQTSLLPSSAMSRHINTHLHMRRDKWTNY